MIYSNFDEIITRDGAEVLFDSHRFGLKCRQLEEIGQTLSAIFSLLTSRSLPATPAEIASVAHRGSEALSELATADTKARIGKIGDLPQFVAENWLRQAAREIPLDAYERADELSREFISNFDGLPLNIEADVKAIEGGVVVDSEAVKERIRSGCEYVVPQEMLKEAEAIALLADQLRSLELAGVNALELCSNYARAKEPPTRLERLRDVVTRRHQPGTTHVDLSTYLTMTPIRQ